MTMQLHQIAEKVINRPLLIHPDKAAVIRTLVRVSKGSVPLSL